MRFFCHPYIFFDDVLDRLWQGAWVLWSFFLHFIELSSVGRLYFIPKRIWKNLTKSSFTKPAADFTLGMLLKLLTILFVKGNMRKHFRISTENTNLLPGTDKSSLVSKRHN